MVRNQLTKLKELQFDKWGILIIFLGAVLRFRQYSINRSFWLDEASLANNIRLHSLIFLITHKLDSNQAAPIGFLALEKLLGKISNYQDIFMRLGPLFFGFLSLLVAYGLKNNFRHKASQYTFIGLIAFSPILVYYSSEFKQYGSDAFFTLLIIWVVLNYKRWRFANWILLISGGLAICFCNPAIFVLAPAGVLLLIEAIAQKEKRRELSLILIGAIWILIFLVNYFLSTKNVAQNTTLINYWSNSFAPLPTSREHIKWYINTLLGIVHLGFSQPAPISIYVLPSWYSAVNFFLLALTLFGSYFLYKANRKFFWINVCTVLLVLLASFLQLYPARSRPILFLAPIEFSFLVASLDAVAAFPHKLSGYVTIGLAVFLVSLVFFPGVNLFLHPSQPSNIKATMSFVNKNRQAGDKISVSAWSVPAYTFYENQYQLNDLEKVENVETDFDSQEFINSLCANQQFGRIWIFFSHRFDERLPFLDNVSKKATLLNEFENVDNGVYLFEFSPNETCN